MKLSDLPLDKKAKIKNINLKNINHFQDIGIIEGNTITCVLISPFNDPKAYKINGVTIAIRNKDANEIEVEYLEN